MLPVYLSFVDFKLSTVPTLDWYKECTETLERYQKEQVEQESEKWNTERKPYMEELKDELGLIKKEAAKSDLRLLKWIYHE